MLLRRLFRLPVDDRTSVAEGLRRIIETSERRPLPVGVRSILHPSVAAACVPAFRRIDAALRDAAQRPEPGADPFSLGDAHATTGVLEGAGFHDVRLDDVHEPVLYGHDLAAALAFVRGFQDTSVALASLSDGEGPLPSSACTRCSRRTTATNAAWSSIRVPG